MNTTPFQRSFCPNLTYRILHHWLSEQDIFVNCKKYGHETSHAELISKSTSALLAQGSGKGVDHKVGALAEAIEHYFSKMVDKNSINLLMVDDLKRYKSLVECGIIANLISEYPSCTVLCTQMEFILPFSYDTKKENLNRRKIPVPIELINPEL